MASRSTRTESVVAALLAVALVVGVLLWMYYPMIPRSVLGWVLLLVIGIPTWFLLEWIGERTLRSRFFSRLGSAARIALAVPVLILLLIFASCIIVLGGKLIGGA
jgi:hypothetical protein